MTNMAIHVLYVFAYNVEAIIVATSKYDDGHVKHKHFGIAYPAGGPV